MIDVLVSRDGIAGILEAFLHNISHILVRPAFTSTYRNFFSRTFLNFLQGLTESATRLALDEGCVRDSGDFISAHRQWSHETRTELSAAVASLDLEVSGGSFGWSSLIANNQRFGAV